jgi:heat shock protein HspQ
MKFKSLILAMCLYTSSIFSYSYTAFPAMTPENTIALNPFIYFDGTGAAGQDIFLSYGILSNLDIWSQVSIVTIPQFGAVVDFSAMVRYDLGKSNILAIRANQKWIAPQYHLTVENDRLGFQANIAAQITYNSYKDPAIYAVLCPLVKLFKGKIDIFTEINPGYYMTEGDFANLAVRQKGFGMDIVPGFGISLGKTLISIACPIYNVTTDATPTFGMWWWCPITSK